MLTASKSSKYFYALAATALALLAHRFAAAPTPEGFLPTPELPSPEDSARSGPPSPAQPSDANPTAAPQLPERWKALESENVALRQVQANLEQENFRLRQQLHNVLQWILDNFRGRYPIPEHLVDRLHVTTLNDDFTVHDEFASLVRLSPEERRQLDAAFQAAHGMTLSIYADVLRATVPSPTELVLEIPPHELQGDLVRQHIRGALRTILGDVRLPWAEAAATNDLAHRFGYFGHGTRTIRFQLVEGDEGTESRLRVRDEHSMEDPGGGRTVTIREFSTDQLPHDYESLLQLLPSP
jgi:hypothetical protein